MLGIFCSNDKAAALSKQSLLGCEREGKRKSEKQQGNLQEAANDKRAKSGRGRGAPQAQRTRSQVTKGGRLNSYDTEKRENQWDEGRMRNKECTRNTAEL